ncbi:uncharacterized protein LOC118790300 [Megalops cyprinoides]|uniref:uncharacterized protein LOC118790300 n=1 Tax=Megalops cyprinoides TaxID=118141 RepID=UPI00186432FB|nr:uncharacterized protein LOC118790300 [Megalops cyprinoides]
MKAVTAFEILALLFVAVFTAHGAQGQLTKCDLKSRLEGALLSLFNSTQDNGPTAEELVARIVCKAELTGFNTSLVTPLEMGKKPERAPEREKPRRPGKLEPPRRRGRSPMRGGPPASMKSSESSEESSEEVHTGSLYGLFQLSDCVACANGSSPSSLNMCQMDCARLIDSDISDDISCLEIILMGNQMDDNDGPGKSSSNSKEEMKEFKFPKECASIVPSEYFSGCP